MAKRMLIDAAHPEETRVVVLSGNRLEEFDFETSTKKQIKGNIYLAKVTRVEPSLQAAFVEYGGNRHGFLAFSEIHPDYYRIPVADRQAALAADRAAQREQEETDADDDHHGRTPAADRDQPDDNHPDHDHHADHHHDDDHHDQHAHDDHGYDGGHRHDDDHGHVGTDEVAGAESPLAADDRPEVSTETVSEPSAGPRRMLEESPPDEIRSADHFPEDVSFAAAAPAAGTPDALLVEAPADALPGPTEAIPEPEGWAGDAPPVGEAGVSSGESIVATEAFEATGDAAPAPEHNGDGEALHPVSTQDNHDTTIETVGGDEIDEANRRRARPLRHYKIQEVIKRRQIMLVQVTKEERGNKGAALTTYLSLAGRYCVLMPNTPRGGGVSRKITSVTDRRRLKELMSDLEVPDGMGVIVRTAGSERSKAEIKRDFEYLMRLWDGIRDLTLQSTAPALIYEEGNLIKRSIRDLYTRDLEEVICDGEEGYRTAKAFMKMLMPSHAKRVKPYRDPSVPLFHRFQVETQIDAIHSPVVQLRSGGYIVINPTEALVAIDVNSGRSTKERNIEETAVKTNCEAADEIARQLRLRDLAGLIVIDFIDMEEGRNQATVERRQKEAMRFDRARIQLGRISPFGLLELSRQRLRPSLIEASTQPCPHCNGTGNIRSTESTALHVLRAVEEEGTRRRSAEISIAVPTSVALYILNQKRTALLQSETRYGFSVAVLNDDTLIPPAFRLDRLRALTPTEIAALPAPPVPLAEPEDEDDSDRIGEDEDVDTPANIGDDDTAESATTTESAGKETAGERDDAGRGRPRRRRRRRGGRDDTRGVQDGSAPMAASTDGAPEEAFAGGESDEAESDDDEAESGPAAADSPPGEAPSAEGGEGDRPRRRRGRRGGRRRRRNGNGVEGGAQDGGPEDADAHDGEGHETSTADGDGIAASAPIAETVEFVAEAPRDYDAAAEIAAAFAAPLTSDEPDLAADSVPVMEQGDFEPVLAAPVAPPPPEPAPTLQPAPPPAPERQAHVVTPSPATGDEAPKDERPSGQYNIPEPLVVAGPPPNPRRGWWRR